MKPGAARGWSLALWILPACVAPIGPVDDEGGAVAASLLTPGVRVRVIETERVVFSNRRGACRGEQPSDLDLPDGPVRAFRDTTGAIQLLSPHHPTYRMWGTSFDALGRSCQPVLRSGYRADYDSHDNSEWLWATYRAPDGRIYGLVHNEWHGTANPGEQWRNTVTLVRSDDGGASYVHAAPPGHVIASATYPWDGASPAGYFEPALIERGGFFYALVRTTDHAPQVAGTCLLRTANIAEPRSWRAWTDGDRFETDLSTGQPCRPVIAGAGHAVGNVTFSTRFGKFMAVMMIRQGSRDGFAVRLSDDLIQWGDPIFLVEARMPWPGHTPGPDAPAAYAYPSIVDPASPDPNFFVSGHEVYLYYVRWSDWCDRRLVRIRIRFEDGPPEPIAPPGLFSTSGAVFSSDGRTRCRFASPAHFSARTGGARLEDVARWTAVPSFLIDSGLCPGVPGGTGPSSSYRGLFRIGDGGYYANGLGQYCHLETWDQFVGCSGAGASAASAWAGLPTHPSSGSLAWDGRCPCGRPPAQPPCGTEGFFRIGGGGYYANGIGRYCGIQSFAQYSACTSTPFSALPAYEGAGALFADGACSCGL